MSDGRRRGLLEQLTLGPAFLLLGQGLVPDT
jgi:hypothetical protein